MGTFDDFGNPDDTPAPDPVPAPEPTPAPVAPDANPFTAIVNEAPPKPVAENPFTKIVDANADAEQAHELALRRTLYGVKDTDAVRYAKVQQVSQALGLPADVVGENLEAMQGAEKFQAAPLAHIAEHSPALAAYLAQAQNMAVLKDDLSNLTGMAAYVTGLQAHQAGVAWDPTGTLPPGFTYDKDGSILEHTYGVSSESGQGEIQTQRYDTLQDVAKALTSRQHFAEAQDLANRANTAEQQGQFGPFLGVEAGLSGEYAAFQRGIIGEGEDATEVASQLGRASQAVSPGLWGDVQRMTGGLVADAPALLAGGGLARGAEAAMRLSRLSPLLTEAFGNKAAQWLATSGKTALTMAPVNAVHAADEARKDGAGAGIIDFLSSSTIMGLTGPTGVARALVRPSEPLVLRGWDAVGQHILKDAGLQASQGAALVMSQVLQGTYQGDDQQLAHDLISQGELGGIAGAAFATLPALAARQALADTHRAAEGIEFGTKLDGLRAHWQATSAAEHSPDALQGAVGAMQAGQPTHVFAQGADWRDHWIAEGQDPQAKADQYGVGDQYREALSLGSDMPIPLEKFLAATSDSKNPLNLEGKAKSAPGASSAEEGAKFYQQTPEQIKAQAQKLGEDAARLTAEGSPTSDAIHQDLLSRLQAVHPKSEGQFTTSQLDTFAQFASTWFDMTAKRSGMDPVAFYNAFPLDLAHGDFVAMHRDLTGAMESGDQSKVDVAMQRMKAAAPQMGEQIKASAVEGVGPSAEMAISSQYQQQGIPVPDNATGLHRATTLRGIWKAAHGGKMPERGDKAWERLVEMSDRVDRANAADKSGVDPQAKTERITRMQQGSARGPHGKSDYATDKAGADVAEKRLGPDGVGRELVATLKDMDRVPLVTAENVPYGMGMDAAGTKVYKDPAFPLKLKLKGGKTVDTLNTTKVHEITETRLMKAGMSYEQAHDVANAVERAYLKSKGYTPKEVDEYERDLEPTLRKVRDWTGEPPADLNRAPYEQEGDTALLEKPAEKSAATDTAHLQQATKDWLAAQPEDVQRRLGPSIDYLRENPDPGGELGNLKMIAERKPRTKLNQEVDSRGSMDFGNGRFKLTTGKGADVSTLYHELMHMWTEVMGDLAQRIETPEALKADYQKMLEFSGYGTHAQKQAMLAEAARINSGAKGRELTPEESKRIAELQAPHEKLSEALERYLTEGVAPVQELRGMFRRISAWIKQVYRTLKASNVELSPEIRGVFDRLLASDDAIERARQTLGDGEPMFRNAADAGWTPEQFDAYNKAVEEERASEEARLQSQVMKELARQKSDAYKAKAAEVSEQVTDLMDKQPVWNALSVLRGAEAPEASGIKGPFRIDRQSVVDAYGEDGLKRLPGRKDFATNPNNRGNPVYSAEDGVPLDAAAKVLGFSTGDELYQALVSAPHKSAAVALETDKIMQAKYPTLERVLADKAVESLHSDRKSRLIMRVLDSLGVKTGQRPAPVELLRAVAKDTIANRATVDVRPKVYRDAEAKAAREVLKAMAAGDYEKAFAEQQRRLLAAELFRAATDAMERVDKFRDWQTKFDKEVKRTQLIKASSEHFAVRNPDGTRQEFATEDQAKAAALRTGGQWEPVSDYMDAIDALRDRYQLSERKPPASVRDFVNGKLAESAEFMKWKSPEEAEQTPEDFLEEQKRTAGITMSEGMIDGPGAGSVNKATVDELDELNSALRNIEKLAMDRGKSITEDSTASYREQKAVLLDQLQATKKRLHKNAEGRPTFVDKFIAARDSLADWHTALSAYALDMDGFKEGGPWWDALVRPMNEAATRAAELTAADGRAFDALAETWGKRDNLGGIYRQKVYDDIAPGLKLSLEARVMIALNWGAKHNRERLMTGHGWSADQVAKIIGTLDKKDMDFVQGIWGHIASKWPDIKAQDQRLFGTELEQRETVPVQTEHGLYKGGYFPIKYDSRESGRAAGLEDASAISEQRRGSFGAAKTRGSFTERVSETTGYKLLTDFSVIYRHFDEVNTRLSHEDALKGIRRLLMDKEVSQTIDRTHGVGANRMIRSAITDAAKGTERLGGMWKGWNHLNKGVSSAAFAWNVFRGIRDFAESIQNTVVRAGWANTADGLKQWGTNAIMMKGSTDKIVAMSRMMADRHTYHLRRAEDAMKSAEFAGSFRQKVKFLADACMHKFHLMTDNLSFLANHNKASQLFPDNPAKALAVAEGMTKDANGSPYAIDMAKIQRGNELMKMFTIAYGFFAKTWQAQRMVAGRAGVQSITNPADWVRATAANPLKVGRAFVDYLTLYTMPIAIDYMIKQAVFGDPHKKEKDWGEIAKEFAKEHISYGLATMVGFRELSGALSFGGSYGGPAGARGLASIYSLIAHAGETSHASERAAIQTAGVLLHLPAGTIQKLIDGYAYAQEHHEGAPTTLLRAVTGKPPKIP